MVKSKYAALSAGAMDSIDATKLNDVAQKLLVPTSMRGGTLSAKQQLKREKAMYDAGLALSDDAMLFKRRGGATGDEQQLPNSGSHLSPYKKPLDSESGAAAEQDSADDDTHPTQASHDVPADTPCRAPPISVTFSKRNKATEAQQDWEAVDGEASTAPLSTQLTEEQKQSVAQAKKDLKAAGEIQGTASSHNI